MFPASDRSRSAAKLTTNHLSRPSSAASFAFFGFADRAGRREDISISPLTISATAALSPSSQREAASSESIRSISPPIAESSLKTLLSSPVESLFSQEEKNSPENERKLRARPRVFFISIPL